MVVFLLYIVEFNRFFLTHTNKLEAVLSRSDANNMRVELRSALVRTLLVRSIHSLPIKRKELLIIVVLVDST